MGRLKFDQTPGRPRGQGYFPQLKGLGRALEAFQPRGEIGGKDERTANDVDALRNKQAEKLARRAARAKG